MRGDNVQGRRAPGHDRRRTGVVEVSLVDPATLEQPHTRRQLRWHIDHLLTGADELLSEQRPHTRRPLDRPRTRRERRRPLHQPASLMPIGVDTDRRDDDFATVDDDRRMRPLVRIDPNDEHDVLLASWLDSPRRAHLIRVNADPLTSHTATEPHRIVASFESQPPGGRAFMRHTRPDPRRYGTPPRRCPTSSIRAFCVSHGGTVGWCPRVGGR
jgi:hypothetical protein